MRTEVRARRHKAGRTGERSEGGGLRHSLRVRMLLFFLIVTLVSIGVLATSFFVLTAGIIRENSNRLLADLVQQIAAEMDDLIRKYGLGAGLRICGRHCRRLVPDYAVDVVDGCLPVILCAVPSRSRNWQTHIRDHPGGRRARCDRHGTRRKLDGGTFFYADQWARYLADE